MIFVYLLASLQALFLVALLLAKKNRSPADRVLMWWLLGIGIHTGIYFMAGQFGRPSPFLMTFNAGFPYLQGPFLLAYVAALVGLRDRIELRDWLHLLPFGFFVFYALWIFRTGNYGAATGQNEVTVSLYSVGTLLTAWLFLSVPVYIVASLFLMRRARRVLDDPELPATFRWIQFFLVGLGVIWVVTIANYLLVEFIGVRVPGYLPFAALTVFVYGLGYLGLTRTTIFLEPQMEKLREEMQPKYQKSGLGPEETRMLHGELTRYLHEERPWLDAELSLQSLADQMGMSANHLSQVINESGPEGFRDTINRLRVMEACTRMDGREVDGLLDLAMDCGFASKSSFNRAFKKFTGKTPSQYLGKPDE